jgi:ATP diphosphatase
MAKLRDPDGGCPWDREQDFSTIAPYTIEEAYEVADAIQHGDMGELRDELGDLLQVVFHARMAEEKCLRYAPTWSRPLRQMVAYPRVRQSGDDRARVGGTAGSWEQVKARDAPKRRSGRQPARRRPRGMANCSAVKL